MPISDGHAPKKPMRVAILAFPGFQALDVIGPLEVFAEVNRLVEKEIYQVEIVSSVKGPLSGCSGLGLVPTRTIFDRKIPVDTFLVSGGPYLQTHTLSADEAVWVRETAKRARRYGSICTGAFIMAQVGLLDGRRVTTHWSKAENLAKRFPNLIMEADSIFVCDGPVCTSAGVAAGIDLALAMVEADCGRMIALDTARELVIYLKRAGGQSQFSTHLSTQMSSLPAIENIQIWISDNLKADLSVGKLAKRAGMSTRNFSRIFMQETGVTPKDFVEGARVDLARRLIADNISLQHTATQSGFVTISNLRRAFARRLMTTPSIYRENFGKDPNHRVPKG